MVTTRDPGPVPFQDSSLAEWLIVLQASQRRGVDWVQMNTYPPKGGYGGERPRAPITKCAAGKPAVGGLATMPRPPCAIPRFRRRSAIRVRRRTCAAPLEPCPLPFCAALFFARPRPEGQVIPVGTIQQQMNKKGGETDAEKAKKVDFWMRRVDGLGK